MRDWHQLAIPTLVLAFVTAALGAQAPPTPPAAPPATQGGDRVHTLVADQVGGVGGVAVDRAGFIYVADFRETVWKVTPDGRAEVFATGLYGASGNAVDGRGNLLQASFYGHYISRIDRHGEATVIAEGLQGPVGIAVGGNGELYVCNCQGNTIARVTGIDEGMGPGALGTVTTFAESEHLNCPNGITRDGDGNLYVVNFSDAKLLKITPDGAVSVLADLPGGGNGHVTMARGDLYATAFRGHRIYRIAPATGELTHIAGTGAIGTDDGPALEATFSWPNGIAVGATGDRLYVNDFVNRFPPTVEVPPVPRWSLRQIKLSSFADVLLGALREGGVPAMEKAYRAWKRDPATAGGFTEIEVNRLAYGVMAAGQVEAALAIFALNAESYPNSFNVWDSLAEAHMKAGEREKAIELYEKSLAINPANANATAMLEKLRTGSDSR